MSPFSGRCVIEDNRPPQSVLCQFDKNNRLCKYKEGKNENKNVAINVVTISTHTHTHTPWVVPTPTSVRQCV